jgi:hypothetical protein
MTSRWHAAAAMALVLLTATSASALSVPWETRTGYMTDGRFGWTYSYDIGVFEDVLTIDVDIALTGTRVGSRLRNRWEAGIETLWSTERFSIPIRFNVDWVRPRDNPDRVVRVRRGFGYWNINTWYTAGASGWGGAFQDEVAAHEYGHMISLWDEYAGGAIDPVTRLIDTGGLMHTLDGPTLDYYYEPFLSWYEQYAPAPPPPPPGPAAPNVGSTGQKGSLLIFPLIDVRDGTTTSIRIANDFNTAVDLRCHFVNQTDFRAGVVFRLTGKQSVVLDAATGVSDPLGHLQPFPTEVGPVAGNPFLGELVCFAVNAAGSQQISFNHLSGTATIATASQAGTGSYEYTAWSFKTRGLGRGTAVGNPGQLDLTGEDGAYDACPAYNIVHFSPTSAVPEGLSDQRIGVSSCAQDLRQDYTPHSTKLEVVIWNAQEVKFTGAWHCANTTASFVFSEMDVLPENASAGVLGTATAQARLRGVASTHCPGSEAAGLVAVSARVRLVDPASPEIPLHGTTANRAGISAVPGFVLWDPSDREVPEAPRR